MNRFMGPERFPSVRVCPARRNRMHHTTSRVTKAQREASRPCETRLPEEPLIIQYVNLLHQYPDPQAPEVCGFVNQHQDDSVFIRRVEMLNRVFRLKEQLVMA